MAHERLNECPGRAPLRLSAITTLQTQLDNWNFLVPILDQFPPSPQQPQMGVTTDDLSLTWEMCDD